MDSFYIVRNGRCFLSWAVETENHNSSLILLWPIHLARLFCKGAAQSLMSYQFCSFKLGIFVLFCFNRGGINATAGSKWKKLDQTPLMLAWLTTVNQERQQHPSPFFALVQYMVIVQALRLAEKFHIWSNKILDNQICHWMAYSKLQCFGTHLLHDSHPTTSPITLSLNRKLYEQYSDSLLGLILI